MISSKEVCKRIFGLQKTAQETKDKHREVIKEINRYIKKGIVKDGDVVGLCKYNECFMKYNIYI